MSGEIGRDLAGLAIVACGLLALYGALMLVRGNRERDALEQVCSHVEDAQENGNDDPRLRPAVKICERMASPL